MNEQEVEKNEEKKEPNVIVDLRGKLPNRPFPTWLDLLSTVGVFALSVVVGSFFVASMMQTRGVTNLTPDMTFIYYLIQMLPTIAFVMWLRRRAGRESAVRWGVRRVNLPILLWGFVVMTASSIVLEPLLSLFPTEPYEDVTANIGFGGWAILSTVVAAPILEELLFRGLIFESCRERFGNAWAVLTSALLFGLIHIVPVQMVNAFVVGIILGYIYLKTGSLLSVIILHAINNAIAYTTMYYFADSADVTLESMFASKTAYWIVYSVAAAIFIFALIHLWRMLRSDRSRA